MKFFPRDTNMEEFYKYVDRKFLPEEIGGNQTSCKVFHDELIQKFKNLRDRFNSEERELNIT